MEFWISGVSKDRIMTFLHPSPIFAVRGITHISPLLPWVRDNSWGRGVGYGTQSKLQFLPEYETDFIFAAYAEEWGLVGVLLLFSLFSIVIWRVLFHALRGATNFERLFATGVAILFVSHFLIHIGMNIGLLPSPEQRYPSFPMAGHTCSPSSSE
ncbi:FtsW/RodA/SpoVE family cell cycle protein [Candidatus Kaiserbacteria bacterium]|nr:MAG: FtsW/RodA/SpoVE family cell cycle protein [Candidatus Kaiserbacteria bacterium]